jgi:hypothetical protein
LADPRNSEQISGIATPVVPQSLRIKHRIATDYFDQTGRCLYCVLLHEELACGKRVVTGERSLRCVRAVRLTRAIRNMDLAEGPSGVIWPNISPTIAPAQAAPTVWVILLNVRIPAIASSIRPRN